jgi:hypothetical protein
VACPAPYPWGDDRSGGHISQIKPSRSNGNVVWTATSTGRVFVTTNALTPNPSQIVWHRIDTSSSVDPNRYVTDIYVDSTNPNHAFISYSGYNQATPTTPGHVFEVLYNPATFTATFTSLDGSGNKALGDLPVGAIVLDEKKDTLYAGTDFGIVTSKGKDAWNDAHPGLPTTTIPFLSLDPENRVLYVTTHGFGAWSLKLP